VREEGPARITRARVGFGPEGTADELLQQYDAPLQVRARALDLIRQHLRDLSTLVVDGY
jgi:hypothetical protein